MARKFTGKIVTYGVKSVATFKVQQIQDLGLGRHRIHRAPWRARDVISCLPLLGQHNVANALAAIAVGAHTSSLGEDPRSDRRNEAGEEARGSRAVSGRV